MITVITTTPVPPPISDQSKIIQLRKTLIKASRISTHFPSPSHFTNQTSLYNPCDRCFATSFNSIYDFPHDRMKID
ncbi:hypothetical protein L6452_28195 [Arctium lappa]|uniref:Uncharacterized protein n=1 Tax=Arctium lappa TaxID=4217 RepID=A0ACB8ZWS8_ARCLA|nr:hypothetical protein L6452_28195 [Arctium lappa]